MSPSAQTDSQHFSLLVHIIRSKPRKFSFFYFLLPCGNGSNVGQEQTNKLIEERTSTNIEKNTCRLYLLTEAVCKQHWAYCFGIFFDRLQMGTLFTNCAD